MRGGPHLRCPYNKGVFFGAGLEVSYYSTRDDDTRDFYGLNGRGSHSSTFRLNLSHFVTETTLRIPQ